jgi:hypothetical protein
MAYGIVSKGHNGFLGINSDWPSLVFVGKATWTGTGSVFPADHQSYQWVRNFGPYQPGSGLYLAPASNSFMLEQKRLIAVHIQPPLQLQMITAYFST